MPLLQVLPLAIPAGDAILTASLVLPDRPQGLIMVVRTGEGLTGHLCDHCIARVFGRHQLATLLVNFTAPDESSLPVLTAQLEQAALWTRQDERIMKFPLGCLGIGMGAAAGFIATEGGDAPFHAIVSVVGQLALAMESLSRIQVPVLLIATGDAKVVQAHQAALAKISAPASLHVIPHAASLEEPGALEDAAQLSALWFAEHLGNVIA